MSARPGLLSTSEGATEPLSGSRSQRLPPASSRISNFQVRGLSPEQATERYVAMVEAHVAYLNAAAGQDHFSTGVGVGASRGAPRATLPQAQARRLRADMAVAQHKVRAAC